MFNKNIFFLKKKNKDSGAVDDALITPIFIILALVIVTTMVDLFLFYSAQDTVSNTAHDGAKIVANFGGNGTSSSSTTIEYSKGQTYSETCGVAKENSNLSGVVKSTSTAVECSIMNSIAENRVGFFNARLLNVTCNPVITKSAGENTTCQIEWEYNPIPLSFFAGFKATTGSEGFLSHNVVTESSKSQTALTEEHLIPRAK